VRAIRSLPSRAKEVTSYVALSNRNLSLKDLQALAGSEKGPEDVAELIATASGVLSQTRGHVQLVHEHLRETLVGQLRESPTRLAFFASRLGRYFEHSGHFVAAFHAYSDAGEFRHVDRLLGASAHQAELMGGGDASIAIFRRQAEVARENGSADEEINALLALASALQQTGARAEAVQALAKARAAAEHKKDRGLILRVSELELALNLNDRPRPERVSDLRDLQQSYVEAGDAFNAARIKTVMAVEYVSGHDFVSAERLSREVLETFNSLGDEYGIRIARINLAAALTGMEGRESEAAALAQELQQELDPGEHPRERAVLCNFLTRYYREQGDTARASEFAIEALQIGRQMNDHHVIAINTINLGNVRRDEGKIEEALDEYRGAERAAVEAGLREHEATANELIASIQSQRGQYGIALKHAEHASALARAVGDSVLIARCEEERAIALKGERDVPGAMSAYADAAKAIAGLDSGSDRFVSLIIDSLDLSIASSRIDLRIELLRHIFTPDLQPIAGADKIHPLHALYAALPRMASTIQVTRLLPIVVLSMADLLAGTSPVVKRRIVRQAIDALLSAKPHVESSSLQAAVAAILMARSGAGLTKQDLVYLSERVAKSSANLYFKPQSDGALHWTIRLQIGGGVTVTLMQLDAEIDTGITAIILVLLLGSLEEMIRSRLLDAEEMPRAEATIYMCGRKDIETSLGHDFLNLGDMPNRFSIGESTDPGRKDQPPSVLILSEEFVTSWNPQEHAFSDLHQLFSELLRVLVTHLLAKAIEPEVLFPKISNLVREIGHLHAADANPLAKN
jgi:tetratricopeptide (TPR) repeat protein